MSAPKTRESCNKTEAPDEVKFREEMPTLIKDEINDNNYEEIY
jgi:hypothetical protein